MKSTTNNQNANNNNNNNVNVTINIGDKGERKIMTMNIVLSYHNIWNWCFI